MAKRRTESTRRSTGRNNLATFLLLLLPGFMFIGLLAPAAVTVKRVAPSEVAGPVALPNLESARLPLIGARAFASAAIPDMSTLDPLFAGARYLAREAQQMFGQLQARAEEDETIVLEEDGVEDYVTDTLFEQPPDEPVLAVDLSPLWDPSLFDVIPGLIARDGYSQYDDFVGTGNAVGGAPVAPVIVPEPETGALVAIGLIALALRASRRRS